MASSRQPVDAQRIGADGREIPARFVQRRQSLPGGGAMGRLRAAQRQPVEKCQQRRRAFVEQAILGAFGVTHRQGAGDAARRQMLQKAQEKRQILGAHALFVEREDVRAALGVQVIVGILDALGDALEAQRLARL